MHDRVNLRTPLSFSAGTLLGLVCSFAIIGIMLASGIGLNHYPALSFIAFFIPIFVGNAIDQQRRGNLDDAELQDNGFEPIEPDSLDPELIEVLARHHPRSIKQGHIRFGYIGSHEGVETVLLQSESTSGDQTVEMAVCAVWTPLDLPRGRIRRRGLRDHVGLKGGKSKVALSEHHVLETPDGELERTMNQLHEWFILKYPKPRSFRIWQPQGLKESWSFGGNWVSYCDAGEPDAAAFERLASFTRAFVADLERAWATTTPIQAEAEDDGET